MACKRITTANLLEYRRPKKKERTLPQRLLTCWSANALSIPSTVHVSERGTVVFRSQIQLSAPSMLSSVTFTACSCQQSESIAHLIEHGNYSMIYYKIVLRKKMHQFTLKKGWRFVPTWVFKQRRKNQLLWEILNAIMVLEKNWSLWCEKGIHHLLGQFSFLAELFAYMYIISQKWSANQQKQLHNNAFYIKTSQPAKISLILQGPLTDRT